MSTMYYLGDQAVGQSHYRGKGNGSHFAWKMTPDEFFRAVLAAAPRDSERGALVWVVRLRNEYGEEKPLTAFLDDLKEMSKSYDPRIE